jgi:hypothetical protein
MKDAPNAEMSTFSGRRELLADAAGGARRRRFGCRSGSRSTTAMLPPNSFSAARK